MESAITGLKKISRKRVVAFLLSGSVLIRCYENFAGAHAALVRKPLDTVPCAWRSTLSDTIDRFCFCFILSR